MKRSYYTYSESQYAIMGRSREFIEMARATVVTAQAALAGYGPPQKGDSDEYEEEEEDSDEEDSDEEVESVSSSPGQSFFTGLRRPA